MDLLAVEEPLPPVADGGGEAAAVLADVLGRVVGQQAEVEALVGPLADASGAAAEQRAAVREVGADVAVGPGEGFREQCESILGSERLALRGVGSDPPSGRGLHSPSM
jgi:hypothetical protein